MPPSQPNSNLTPPLWYTQLLLPAVRQGKSHAFLLTGETDVLNTDAGIEAGELACPLERFLWSALVARPITVLINTAGEMEVRYAMDGKDYAGIRALKALQQTDSTVQRFYRIKELLEEGDRVAVIVMDVDTLTALPQLSPANARTVWELLRQIIMSSKVRDRGGLLLLQSSQREFTESAFTSRSLTVGEIGRHVECIPVEPPTAEERTRCLSLLAQGTLTAEALEELVILTRYWSVSTLQASLSPWLRPLKGACDVNGAIRAARSCEYGGRRRVARSCLTGVGFPPKKDSLLRHGQPHIARYAQHLSQALAGQPSHSFRVVRLVSPARNGEREAAELIAHDLGMLFVQVDTLPPAASPPGGELRDLLIALAPIVVYTEQDIEPLKALFAGYRLRQPIILVSTVHEVTTVAAVRFTDGAEECLVLPLLSQEERCDVIEAFYRAHGDYPVDETKLQEVAAHAKDRVYAEVIRQAQGHRLPALTESELRTADLLTLHGLLQMKDLTHAPQLAHVLVREIWKRREDHLGTDELARVKALYRHLPR